MCLARKMTQSVKWLPYKHTDLSLDFPHPGKSQAWQYVSAKTDRFLNHHYLDSLLASESNSLRNQGERGSRDPSGIKRISWCSFTKPEFSFLFQCRQLRNACNSSSRGSNTLLWPQWAHVCGLSRLMYVHKHRSGEWLTLTSTYKHVHTQKSTRAYWSLLTDF